MLIHAYILKEFNNRWFLIEKKGEKGKLITLALDRMLKIQYTLKVPYVQKDFDSTTYYENTIGVTVLNDEQLQEIRLKLDQYNAPYVLTKPFHHSQELIEVLENKDVIISLKVHLNFELDRLILGFGESIEVLKPRLLRNRIKRKLLQASGQYTKESK